MSNCCKTVKSKYPCCAVEIETHSRDICFLLFYNNWILHTTPIQLVSVLFIVGLNGMVYLAEWRKRQNHRLQIIDSLRTSTTS